MKTLSGILMLVLVLCGMSLFSFKAPRGKKSLSALSGAACATFLPEAFLRYAVGGVFHLDYVSQIGETMGSLGGLAAGALVPLAFGISPVFSIILGLSLIKVSLLPAFITAYLLSFVVEQMQKRIPEGIDLLVVILVIPVAASLVAGFIQPVVLGVLEVIGGTILSAVDGNPYVMGAILGAIIPIVGMTPLSSMVLTALIGLTGVPMAVGALTCYGSSIVNAALFKKLKLGTASTPLAVAIEPLTQVDIISSNPIPIYATNLISGMVSGIVVTFFGLKVPVTGMATPWAGLLVTLGNNAIQTTLLAVAIITVVSLMFGFLGALVFKRYRIEAVDNTPEFEGTTEVTSEKEAVKPKEELRMNTAMAINKPKKVNKVMNYKSCFDIIGPIMIGPSSSHTAGALAIGLAARKLFGGTPEKIVIKYYESFADTHKGHGTDFAIIGGILGLAADDANVTQSIELAEEQGIEIQFLEMSEESPVKHANTACVTLSDATHEIHLTGISVGGGTIEVKYIELDGFNVQLHGPLPILLVINQEEQAMQAFKDTLQKNNIQVNAVSRYVEGNQILFIFDLDSAPISSVKEQLFSLDDTSKIILL
ncbi:L-serine dehydratase, iron-sulfur-dependent, beta subunit [Enterococcus faecalis EnGen0240]|nr:L-serine dehydratase, iron-sulfur-dependent, beta subunit [Enterococcus faecalis EnGen0240]